MADRNYVLGNRFGSIRRVIESQRKVTEIYLSKGSSGLHFYQVERDACRTDLRIAQGGSLTTDEINTIRNSTMFKVFKKHKENIAA